MRIEILDEAERDLIEGFRFYESQSAGLGEYFLNSVFSDIDSLNLYAGVHSHHFGYFRLLAKRFPFAIYYTFDGKRARVHAVLDCRRDPERAKKRLTGE